jgi:GR25 family glycosyltransferase involved in LPS biosynthesis
MKFFHLLIASAVIFFSALSADLSQYFKKTEHKSNNHTMRNIDFIYLINLDNRPQKFQKCLGQLHPYGINPYRFSGVNGYALSLEQISDMGVKLTPEMKRGELGIYFSPDDVTGYPTPHTEMMNCIGKTYFYMPNGGIGCELSHLSVLQDALDNKYEIIWVMEDDIEIVKDPRILSDMIDQLNRLVGRGNWDVLYTDIDRRNDDGTYHTCGVAPNPGRPNYSPPNPGRFSHISYVGENFRRIGARFGTHSYIVSQNGIKKILNFVKSHNLFLHYDQDIFIVPDISLYTVRDDIVTNLKHSPSDIFFDVNSSLYPLVKESSVKH